MNLYHYSPTVLSELRSLNQQVSAAADSRKSALQGNVDDDYYDSISFFPFPLAKKDIEELINNGFTQWGKSNLIEHVVDMSKSSGSITRIELVSTPLQNAFFHDNWSKMVGSVPGNKRFEEGKRKYLAEEKRVMDAAGYGPYYTVKDFLKSKGYKEIMNTSPSDWVKLNIKEGSRVQYATCIPHIMVYVTAPIVPTKTSDLKLEFVSTESESPHVWSRWGAPTTVVLKNSLEGTHSADNTITKI